LGNSLGRNVIEYDNLKLSGSDIVITRKIKESGNVMDKQLLNHLIIVLEGRYLSMRDEGII
jgi:DNA repair protein RadC